MMEDFKTMPFHSTLENVRVVFVMFVSGEELKDFEVEIFFFYL